MKMLICYGYGEEENLRIKLKQDAISYLQQFLSEKFRLRDEEKEFLNKVLNADEICVFEREENGCKIKFLKKEAEFSYSYFSEDSLFSKIYKKLFSFVGCNRALREFVIDAKPAVLFKMFSWSHEQLFEVEVQKIELEQLFDLIKQRAKKIRPNKKLMKKLLSAEEISLELEKIAAYELQVKSNGKYEEFNINPETAEILWTIARCFDLGDIVSIVE